MSDAKLLRETFEIAAAEPLFGARFYEHLFREHPSLVPMFTRNSSGAQQKMFAQKLAAIVDAVEQTEVLRAEVEAIARSHGKYGVTPEMYGWVGAALLATMRELVGPAWSDESERAWVNAYATITRMILASPQ